MLPQGATNVQIAADGAITASSGNLPPTAVATIGLAMPTAPQGMVASGFGLWAARWIDREYFG